MKTFKRIYTLLIVCILFSGYGSTLIAQSSAEPSVVENDTLADIAAIKKQSRRFSEAYVREDIETLVSIYTVNGVAAPGGSDFIRNREALERYWKLPEGRTILHHIAKPLDIIVDGNHAYDWGYYEGQAAQNGKPLNSFRGKYVIIWFRDADGIWRIAVDMWNSLPELDQRK